jgi:adenylate cyclase
LDQAEIGNFITRGWRNVREAGVARLAFTGMVIIIAVLIARFSWYMPLTDFAERGLYDSRSYAFAERVEQDPRILLVEYSDQTLLEARKRSPLDRGMLADVLRKLDQLGPKAIGIDIVFDQPQDEDDELIEALRAMETPTAVAYFNMATNEGDLIYEQQEFLDQFFGRLEGSNAFPASIRLSDESGVTRVFPQIEPTLPPLLARAMLQAAGEEELALPGYEGSIHYRIGLRDADSEGAGKSNVSMPVFSALEVQSINALPDDPEILELLRGQVEGRYVFIGSNLVDVDQFSTSLTSNTNQTVPGMQIHAAMLAQMLDGKGKPYLPSFNLWILAILMVVVAIFTGLLEFDNWRIYPLVALQAAMVISVPFIMHWRGTDTYDVPAAGWILGWVVAFSAVTSAARASGAVERKFAQGALGKYLPREMAREIIEKPKLLALHGEKKQICVLFSDLEGFTKMSHALTPEQVAIVLNRYLEKLSKVVLDHGGVIDKFVGDAVVAFWGAPIARPDDADRAAKAGYAIWQAGEDFRREIAEMDSSLPPVGKTRVGLHFGEAVVGNFGGENRIQYTALGDSMNTAARLESANKALDSSVMASRELAERTKLDWWRPMGKVILRGRSQPVELMEPAPHIDAAKRQAVAEAMALFKTKRGEAIIWLEEIFAQNPNDKALDNLLHRLRNQGVEDAYVLS